MLNDTGYDPEKFFEKTVDQRQAKQKSNRVLYENNSITVFINRLKMKTTQHTKRQRFMTSDETLCTE